MSTTSVSVASLSAPTLLDVDSDETVKYYQRSNVIVAFSKSIGWDTYYFGNREEMDRLLYQLNYPNGVTSSTVAGGYQLSDLRIEDLAYNFDELTLEIVDRNTRIPSGYMICRPWFPKGSFNISNLLLAWPSYNDDW
jgi:hypothetical protein